MTEKESKWIKFCPSLELPKERVSIAYDTHDDRGYRFAYGYFQFNNGTCGCFWKDGNEQPKVVKSEDIKYWMPVPSLDVQEEPVSEELKKVARQYAGIPEDTPHDLNYCVQDKKAKYDAVLFGAHWQKEQFEKNRLKHCNSITNEQAELEQKFLDQHLDKNNRMPTFLDAIEYGMKLQKEKMIKDAIEGYWIARDAPDILHPLRIHDNKIERKILDDGRKYWYCRHGDSIYLPSNLFQEIQWESEPCKVKLLILKEE